MRVSLYVICCFPLVALIFFLNSQFYYYVSQHVPPFVSPFWESLYFWTWMTVSFLIGRFPPIISSNIFLGPFSLSFLSKIHVMQTFVHLMSQKSLRLSSFLFILFSLFCSTAIISTILPSSSLIHSSASVTLPLIPSSVFFILVVVLFNSICSSYLRRRILRMFSYLSCIFSVCASVFL